MWRSIINTFERYLVLNSKQFIRRNNTVKINFNSQTPVRFLICSATLRNVENVSAAFSGVREGDSEYIVPYKAELEKAGQLKILIKALRSRFHLSKVEVERIVNDEAVLTALRQRCLQDAIDVLFFEGITKENLIQYPWLITITKKKLKEKIILLRTLNGCRDINDFVPFLRIQYGRLSKLVSLLNTESVYFNNSNRVYFLAEQLNVLPCIVTKYLAKRLFVLEIPFEMFTTNLQHMLHYNVKPMNILRDLWSFRYTPQAVELRLQRALDAKKDKIMPWMIRCPEPILQKSLQLSLDELQVLGDKTTVAEYVGERLGFPVEEAQAIMDRHPLVNGVRVTKIKEILDYLLDEAKFTRHEIAQVPRILCHKLDTTKKRIEELAKYGCRPSTLVIVCRSNREYQKFLQNWQNTCKYYDKVAKKEADEQ